MEVVGSLPHRLTVKWRYGIYPNKHIDKFLIWGWIQLPTLSMCLLILRRWYRGTLMVVSDVGIFGQVNEVPKLNVRVSLSVCVCVLQSLCCAWIWSFGQHCYEPSFTNVIRFLVFHLITHAVEIIVKRSTMAPYHRFSSIPQTVQRYLQMEWIQEYGLSTSETIRWSIHWVTTTFRLPTVGPQVPSVRMVRSNVYIMIYDLIRHDVKWLSWTMQ